ncbi:hypothetical protein N7454_001385 [Penicillium verhagenii]|nr:hypothetical protein N7454_001385 [Penicillium verhagenii]
MTSSPASSSYHYVAMTKPARHDPIGSFFTSNASIIIGSNPSKPVQSTTHYESRSRYLTHFHRYVHMAWDMELLNTDPISFDSNNPAVCLDETGEKAQDLQTPSVKRTVMFEATSETVFKDDPDQFPIKVREFNILDLEGNSDTNLQVIQMRIFLDAKPIQARAASLTKSSAYGESQTETQAD